MVLYYTDKSTEVKEYLKIPPAQNPSTRPWNPEFQHGTEPSDRTPTLNRNESSSDIYLSSPLRGFAFSLSLITLRLSGGTLFPPSFPTHQHLPLLCWRFRFHSLVVLFLMTLVSARSSSMLSARSASRAAPFGGARSGSQHLCGRRLSPLSRPPFGLVRMQASSMDDVAMPPPGKQNSKINKNYSGSALSSAAQAMPLSLFTKGYNEESLPLDGHVLTEAEETCDVEVQRCPTEKFVYETPCPVCSGSGTTRAHATSRRRGARAHSGTCPACHGLGVVRQTTTKSTKVPEDAEEFTVGRPKERPKPDTGKAKAWKPRGF